VHSPVVYTQSVTSAAIICSNLWGRWRADQAVTREQTISKMNIGNNLGTIDMCMHWVFLHANRVGTVHTAYSGPFNFLQGANTADVILGIKKKDRQ